MAALMAVATNARMARREHALSSSAYAQALQKHAQIANGLDVHMVLIMSKQKPGATTKTMTVMGRRTKSVDCV